MSKKNDEIRKENDEMEKENGEIILTDTAEQQIKAAEKPDKQEEQAAPEQSFTEALRAQIHEEETIPVSQKLSVIKILGGDFFTSQILRRQILLMLYISVFVIIYISNRYSCQNSMHEIENLKEELQDMKFKALSTSSELTEKSRQSKVLKKLKENKDSVLHIATQPPFIINIPEENKTTEE